MEKDKKHHIRFHGVKDIEIGHLITIYESKFMNLAVMVFIIGQVLFLLAHPDLSPSLNVNRMALIPLAHLLTFLGEAFLLWCLMMGMKVLRKPLHTYFIATFIGLAILHVALAAFQASTVRGEQLPFDIPIYVVCAIPYAVLGFKISQSYYGELSRAGNLMVIFVLVNAVYLVAMEVIGPWIIADLICLAVAVYFILFLRARLIGSEKVEDISRLKKASGNPKMKKLFHDEVIKKSKKTDIEVDYIVTTQSSKSIQAAFYLFIIGQVIFFLCAPIFSSLIGVDRVALLGLSHFIKGMGEVYMLYCLMRGLADLKYPFKKTFAATIALDAFFYLAVALLCLVSFFGIHELGDAYVYLLVLRIIPYFILAFSIYHLYYGHLSDLGMFMMAYLLVKILIDGFNFTGVLLYTDLILLAISIAYVIYFRKWLIGADTYQEIREKRLQAKDAENASSVEK